MANEGHTDQQNTGNSAQDIDPTSGSKYLSSRDIANFLNGRDVMAARVVDQLCEMAKADPALSHALKDKFNSGSFNGDGVDMRGAKSIAFLKVIQRPEFGDIKEHFEKMGTALRKSMDALESDPLPIRAELDPATEDQLFIKMNSETAQALLCHQGFMDPIAQVANLPPVNPHTIQSFETAMMKEEKKLSLMHIGDYLNGTDNFDRQITRIKPPEFIK